MQLGVQTRKIVQDSDPAQGFRQLKAAGFSCADFSLNGYLTNTLLYRLELNDFFGRSERELERFFTPHKLAAAAFGIRIHQMHMPYPVYLPNGGSELNDYLWNTVAPKSMKVCAFFGCRYLVVHGFKLSHYLGSESAEWEQTERFLTSLAPLARELGITLCIENLYSSVGGHIVEGPGCDAGKAAGRIDRFNEKYGAEVLGFCFDTGHANLVGIDVEPFIKTLGPRIRVLHIHDNDGLGDLHQIPFTFTRTRENTVSTDWAGFLKGLRAIKFDGVLNFETGPVLTAFPEGLRSEALAFIAKIGHYFAKELEGGKRIK